MDEILQNFHRINDLMGRKIKGYFDIIVEELKCKEQISEIQLEDANHLVIWRFDNQRNLDCMNNWSILFQEKETRIEFTELVYSDFWFFATPSEISRLYRSKKAIFYDENGKIIKSFELN
jgi:hypothetical protein